MCWVCGINKSQLVQNYWAEQISAHYQSAGDSDLAAYALNIIGSLSGSSSKNYDAFPADGVGDLKPVTTQNVILLTPDQVADDISTTTSIAVDGGSIVSTIDTIGDQDFFRVELIAGNTYDIGQ